MLGISKIVDYLKLLTDKEGKEFLIITFGACFRSKWEAFYSRCRNKVKKYIALIEKTLEAKIMMQSSSSNDYVRRYKIELLNLFNHSQLKTNWKTWNKLKKSKA